MLQGIETVFDNKEKMMKRLKKKSFETNSAEFVENYGHFFNEMTEHVEQAGDKEAAAKEVADCFIQAVKTRFAGKNGKVSSSTQVDLNFFMIYYIFPSILKTGHEDSKLIADTLCTAWGTGFKDSKIQYTDYDTLYGAFREKIFGII